METIWIPILAVAGLIFLFRSQRGKIESESGSGRGGGSGCGMGCCGGGHSPRKPGERDGKERKSNLSVTDKAHLDDGKSPAALP